MVQLQSVKQQVFGKSLQSVNLTQLSLTTITTTTTIIFQEKLIKYHYNYTIVKQPIWSRLKVKHCWLYLLHVDVISFFVTEECQKIQKMAEKFKKNSYLLEDLKNFNNIFKKNVTYNIKGAVKLYFIYFLCSVIVLFSTGLCKPILLILWKTRLCHVSVFFVLSVCSTFWIWYDLKRLNWLIIQVFFLYFVFTFTIKTICSDLRIMWLKTCHQRGVELL